MIALYWTSHASPLGPLLLVGGEGRLHRLDLPGLSRRLAAPPAGATMNARPFREAMRQLDAYFAGKLRAFELDLAPTGTPFQLRTWEALREIPYGATWSYLDLARRIGQPSATRAVGAANGRNPLPIVVPCHRVIGSNGELRGFGGGLPAKRLLLTLEGALPTADAQGGLFS